MLLHIRFLLPLISAALVKSQYTIKQLKQSEKILDDVISKLLDIPKPHMLLSNTDLKSHTLMLPEFELIGQKRFRTVHNVNKTKPLQFIMKKPKPLRKIIKKRNFDDEPKIEISSVVLKFMDMVLGDAN